MTMQDGPWSPPGQQANPYQWNLSMNGKRTAWFPPGQPAPQNQQQYSLPLGHDARGSNPNYHVMASPPGTPAPRGLVNYTPSTGQVSGIGSQAPIDEMNLSMLPGSWGTPPNQRWGVPTGPQGVGVGQDVGVGQTVDLTNTDGAPSDALPNLDDGSGTQTDGGGQTDGGQPQPAAAAPSAAAPAAGPQPGGAGATPAPGSRVTTSTTSRPSDPTDPTSTPVTSTTTSTSTTTPDGSIEIRPLSDGTYVVIQKDPANPNNPISVQQLKSSDGTPVTTKPSTINVKVTENGKIVEKVIDANTGQVRSSTIVGDAPAPKTPAPKSNKVTNVDETNDDGSKQLHRVVTAPDGSVVSDTPIGAPSQPKAAAPHETGGYTAISPKDGLPHEFHNQYNPQTGQYDQIDDGISGQIYRQPTALSAGQTLVDPNTGKTVASIPPNYVVATDPVGGRMIAYDPQDPTKKIDMGPAAVKIDQANGTFVRENPDGTVSPLLQVPSNITTTQAGTQLLGTDPQTGDTRVLADLPYQRGFQTETTPSGGWDILATDPYSGQVADVGGRAGEPRAVGNGMIYYPQGWSGDVPKWTGSISNPLSFGTQHISGGDWAPPAGMATSLPPESTVSAQTNPNLPRGGFPNRSLINDLGNTPIPGWTPPAGTAQTAAGTTAGTTGATNVAAPAPATLDQQSTTSLNARGYADTPEGRAQAAAGQTPSGDGAATSEQVAHAKGALGLPLDAPSKAPFTQSGLPEGRSVTAPSDQTDTTSDQTDTTDTSDVSADLTGDSSTTTKDATSDTSKTDASQTDSTDTTKGDLILSGVKTLGGVGDTSSNPAKKATDTGNWGTSSGNVNPTDYVNLSIGAGQSNADLPNTVPYDPMWKNWPDLTRMVQEGGTVGKNMGAENWPRMTAANISPDSLGTGQADVIDMQQGADGKWVPPVDPKSVVGTGHKFGEQVSDEGVHKGVDLQAFRGTPARSPVDGVVADIKNNPRGLGLTVSIQDSKGHVHTLGHLGKALVKLGDRVRAGQPVAEVGSSGNSTGPHLDVREQRPDGSPVDVTSRLGALADLPRADTPGGSNATPGAPKPPPPTSGLGALPDMPQPDLGMGQSTPWQPPQGQGQPQPQPPTPPGARPPGPPGAPPQGGGGAPRPPGAGAPGGGAPPQPPPRPPIQMGPGGQMQPPNGMPPRGTLPQGGPQLRRGPLPQIPPGQAAPPQPPQGVPPGGAPQGPQPPGAPGAPPPGGMPGMAPGGQPPQPPTGQPPTPPLPVGAGQSMPSSPWMPPAGASLGGGPAGAPNGRTGIQNNFPVGPGRQWNGPMQFGPRTAGDQKNTYGMASTGLVGSTGVGQDVTPSVGARSMQRKPQPQQQQSGRLPLSLLGPTQFGVGQSEPWTSTMAAAPAQQANVLNPSAPNQPRALPPGGMPTGALGAGQGMGPAQSANAQGWRPPARVGVGQSQGSLGLSPYDMAQLAAEIQATQQQEGFSYGQLMGNYFGPGPITSSTPGYGMPTQSAAASMGYAGIIPGYSTTSVQPTLQETGQAADMAAQAAGLTGFYNAPGESQYTPGTFLKIDPSTYDYSQYGDQLDYVLPSGQLQRTTLPQARAMGWNGDLGSLTTIPFDQADMLESAPPQGPPQETLAAQQAYAGMNQAAQQAAVQTSQATGMYTAPNQINAPGTNVEGQNFTSLDQATQQAYFYSNGGNWQSAMNKWVADSNNAIRQAIEAAGGTYDPNAPGGNAANAAKATPTLAAQQQGFNQQYQVAALQQAINQENDQHQQALLSATTAEEQQQETDRHNLAMEQLQAAQANLSSEQQTQQFAQSLATSALQNPWLQELTGLNPQYGQTGGPGGQAWTPPTGTSYGGILQQALTAPQLNLPQNWGQTVPGVDQAAQQLWAAIYGTDLPGTAGQGVQMPTEYTANMIDQALGLPQGTTQQSLASGQLPPGAMQKLASAGMSATDIQNFTMQLQQAASQQQQNITMGPNGEQIMNPQQALTNASTGGGFTQAQAGGTTGWSSQPMQTASTDPAAANQGGQATQNMGYNIPDVSWSDFSSWSPFQLAAYRTSLESQGPGALQQAQAQMTSEWGQQGITGPANQSQLGWDTSGPMGQMQTNMQNQFFGADPSVWQGNQQQQWAAGKQAQTSGMGTAT